MTHRGDIQSLRALAVGLVVATHAKTPWITGGYVGVDVFFVLSGYLISGIILREIASTCSFDPWRFYARRLKRLLPAMLMVILCTSSVAWITLSPHRQVVDATAAQAASLWLSNFYFSTRTINYFSNEVLGNLFLHTWSLAVEEQFYLVWPWLMLFFYGIWRWQGAPMNFRRLTNGMSMVAVTSLLIAIYFAHHRVEDGFYLMPSRAWEFALGALVYFLREACEVGRNKWLEYYRGRSVLNSVGWLSILLAAVSYSDNLRYPGLWALFPCFGAALVLLDSPEKQPQSVISRLMLHQRLLQFVGNISYSLYLWHWPVLVLGIAIFGGDPITRFGLVTLSLILATATYYVVEKPIHCTPIRSKVKVFIFSGFGMALGFTLMTVWEQEANHLLKKPEQAIIQNARSDLPDIHSLNCDTGHHSSNITPCLRGPTDARHTIVMFGDSVLAQWFPAISEIYLRKPDWRLVVLTKSACPASQVSYFYDRIKANYDVCDLWRQRAMDYIEQLHPDIVIMGSRNYNFSRERWITGTRAVLERLSPVSSSIVILSPTPDLGFNGPDCLAMDVNIPPWMPHHGSCVTQLAAPTNPSILEILQNAAQPYSNVAVLDLNESVCPNKICRARIPSGIVFRDAQHLTVSFVKSLAPAFEHALVTTGIRP
ncbi:MAG: acyltransferase family protein [Azonexus sp.]|nr:acyltransferase family protein [Azonexus sp.]